MAGDVVQFGHCARLVRETVQPDQVCASPYIGLEHIGEGTLQLVGLGTASDVSSAKTRFGEGDILFGKLRPYFRKLVRPGFSGVCSTDIWVVRARPGVDQGYLYYVMASQAFVDRATQGSTGTRMPRAQWTDVAMFPVLLPPLPEQRAIAHILGTLDDKIALNRRLSATLEETARALFKAWFVDFEPVRAKMAGRPSASAPGELGELFPARLVESELGEIPEGWRVGRLGDLVELAVGGLWGEDAAFEGSVPALCLRGADLGDLAETGDASPPLRWMSPRLLARRAMSDRDVIVASSGIGPVGRALWMHGSLFAAFDGTLTYSNFCKRLEAQTAYWAAYVEMVLTRLRASREIWDYIEGTSIPNLLVDHLLSQCAILIPDEQAATAFHACIAPIRGTKYSRESRTLAALRDTLLPRLVSGELRVGEAEEWLEHST